MALFLEYDKVDGSVAEIGSKASQLCRGGFAYYDPVSSAPDPSIMLIDVYAKITQDGYRFGQQARGASNLALVRIPIVPLGAAQFRFQLVYENVSPGNFTFNSTYLLETGGVSQGYETTQVPGSRAPIRVSFDPNAAGAQKVPFDVVPQDYIRMRITRTLRYVRVTQITFGKPTNNLEDYHNYVNSDFWQRRPKGFWRIDDASTRISRYEGFYQQVATMLSRNVEDWSEPGTLQHQQTGRYCPIDPQAIINAFSTPYGTPNSAKGIKFQTAQEPNNGFISKDGTGYAGYNGFVRVYPYPTISFRQLFGFV